MNRVLWSYVDGGFFGRFSGYGGFAAENWRRRLVVVMVLEREMFRRERDGEKKEGVAKIFFFFFNKVSFCFSRVTAKT